MRANADTASRPKRTPRAGSVRPPAEPSSRLGFIGAAVWFGSRRTVSANTSWASSWPSSGRPSWSTTPSRRSTARPAPASPDGLLLLVLVGGGDIAERVGSPGPWLLGTASLVFLQDSAKRGVAPVKVLPHALQPTTSMLRRPPEPALAARVSPTHGWGAMYQRGHCRPRHRGRGRRRDAADRCRQAAGTGLRGPHRRVRGAASSRPRRVLSHDRPGPPDRTCRPAGSAWTPTTRATCSARAADSHPTTTSERGCSAGTSSTCCRGAVAAPSQVEVEVVRATVTRIDPVTGGFEVTSSGERAPGGATRGPGGRCARCSGAAADRPPAQQATLRLSTIRGRPAHSTVRPASDGSSPAPASPWSMSPSRSSADAGRRSTRYAAWASCPGASHPAPPCRAPARPAGRTAHRSVGLGGRSSTTPRARPTAGPGAVDLYLADESEEDLAPPARARAGQAAPADRAGNVHRHRMSPQVAHRLDTVIAEGRLRIHAGHIRSIGLDGEQLGRACRGAGGRRCCGPTGSRCAWSSAGRRERHDRPAAPPPPRHPSGGRRAPPAGDRGPRWAARSSYGSGWPVEVKLLGARGRGRSSRPTAVPELREQATACLARQIVPPTSAARTPQSGLRARAGSAARMRRANGQHHQLGHHDGADHEGDDHRDRDLRVGRRPRASPPASRRAPPTQRHSQRQTRSRQPTSATAAACTTRVTVTCNMGEPDRGGGSPAVHGHPTRCRRAGTPTRPFRGRRGTRRGRSEPARAQPGWPIAGRPRDAHVHLAARRTDEAVDAEEIERSGRCHRPRDDRKSHGCATWPPEIAGRPRGSRRRAHCRRRDRISGGIASCSPRATAEANGEHHRPGRSLLAPCLRGP